MSGTDKSGDPGVSLAAGVPADMIGMKMAVNDQVRLVGGEAGGGQAFEERP